MFNVKQKFFLSSTRDNIGIICLLQPKHANLQNERICVATTHIFFSPKRGDVKLAQIQMLLASIDRIAFKALKKKTKDGLKHLYHP
jgi:mRNA deadenylase 3'-5' endonuclease subunit Ccr4